MTRALLRAAYGAYAIAAFLVVVLLMFCPVLIVAPWLGLRRAIGRLTVRTWLLSIGIHLRVKGLEHLPAGACVVACNHASYVDGIVLTSALPGRFTFLVQHRAADWPYVGLIIRRMGVRFVNRENPRAAARATLGMIRGGRQGESLAIFPEGSFGKEKGLQPFFGGAFLIAAKAGLPVVPAVLRGSRRFFEDGARWPSWQALDIELFAPLAATGTSRAEIAALQRRTFATIERHCGEERNREAMHGPEASPAV